MHGKEEKFFFHINNFDADVIDEPLLEDVEDLTPPPPVFSESELEAAKKQAFQDGHAAGQKEAEESRAQDLANIMKRLTLDLQTLLVSEKAREDVYEREAVALSRTVFEKGFPHFQDAHGFDELSQKMANVLQTMREQSHIDIRVSSDYAKDVSELIEQLKSNDSSLRCDVQEDDTLNLGAFKIEWQDGGALFDHQNTAQAILSNLDDILASKGVPSHNSIDKESKNSADDELQGAPPDHKNEELQAADHSNPIAEDKDNDDG
ncbi:MAG: hypothetical protein AB8B83_09505 [Bdellovibrionales bacterium]